MKKKLCIIVLLIASASLFAFRVSTSETPQEKIKAYYHRQFSILATQLLTLRKNIEEDKNERILHDNFLQARLSYKPLELFIEYYQEPDAAKFNGLAIDFIEEEDPTARQEPQGFQVIESFLYPHYDTTRKTDLLNYTDKLLSFARGLGSNTHIFMPDDYLLDACVEELYRIISLGIAGFDSPLAELSVQEAAAALKSVLYVLHAYEPVLKENKISGLNSTLQLLQQAQNYTVSHPAFNQFNRASFITKFINPVCDWMGRARRALGYPENTTRYTLISKQGSLFAAGSLQPHRYLGDDTITPEKIAFGKKLFYEPLLSLSGKRSCASCHQPGKAFSDGLAKAMDLDEHSALARNTPTLWNAGLQRNLFADSRQTSMDQLIAEVLGNKKEMNSDAGKAAEKITGQPGYNALHHTAYPYGADSISGQQVVNALAMYVRTLVSYNARFDQYMRGQQSSLSNDEIKGFNLFMGKAKCGSCHYMPFFNGSKPPLYYYQESEVIGVPASAEKTNALLDKDPGRMAILPYDFFNHAFKTPSLRNIALTAPYMHNGVYKTLEEVIDFYDKGGGQGLGLVVPNQTLPTTKLGLSSIEKKQLKAFLLSLTDTVGRHY